VGGTFGDIRDRADIDTWADSIADDLGSATPS
jgi:hypothetical protein